MAGVNPVGGFRPVDDLMDSLDLGEGGPLAHSPGSYGVRESKSLRRFRQVRGSQIRADILGGLYVQHSDATRRDAT